jgi:hypothetical protein
LQARNISAKPGSKLTLKSAGSDPDGNSISYTWWQYFEVDTYLGKIDLKKPSASTLEIIIPKDAKMGDTIHLIVEVTDNGTPNLTRYQRTIITVAN